MAKKAKQTEKSIESETEVPEKGAFDSTEAGNDLTDKKPSFQRKKAVTVPVMKFQDEETKFVEIATPITTKDTIDPQTKEPTTIEVADVIDLTTGQRQSLVFGTVLQKELEREYPDQGYVDKRFEIVKHKVEGKRYRTYEVYELEAETEE